MYHTQSQENRHTARYCSDVWSSSEIFFLFLFLFFFNVGEPKLNPFFFFEKVNDIKQKNKLWTKNDIYARDVLLIPVAKKPSETAS
jgi:hypothetical protein